MLYFSLLITMNLMQEYFHISNFSYFLQCAHITASDSANASKFRHLRMICRNMMNAARVNLVQVKNIFAWNNIVHSKGL